MNISGPAAVAKPEMLFYAPGDLTVTFRLMDLTGIDVNYLVRCDRYSDSGDERDKPNPLVEEKYKKGEFGRKTGKGWYDYTK